jgi:hypothetical protein
MTTEIKHGEVRPLLRERASKPEGCSLYDFPELTLRQVSENARNTPGLYVVGIRHQARIFADPAHAAFYRDVTLPAIKAAHQKAKRHEKWLRLKARTGPKKIGRPRKVVDAPELQKAPKQAKAKAEKSPKPVKESKPVDNPKQPKAGVNIPKYTGPKFDKNQPVDYSKAKVTICPSPPAFGPAAKLLGLGQ